MRVTSSNSPEMKGAYNFLKIYRITTGEIFRVGFFQSNKISQQQFILAIPKISYYWHFHILSDLTSASVSSSTFCFAYKLCVISVWHIIWGIAYVTSASSQISQILLGEVNRQWRRFINFDWFLFSRDRLRMI